MICDKMTLTLSPQCWERAAFAAKEASKGAIVFCIIAESLSQSEAARLHLFTLLFRSTVRERRGGGRRAGGPRVRAL